MTLYTSKTVAEWLRLTERRVRQLRDEGVLQEERPGLYDLKASVGRYIGYLGGSGREGLQAERTRLTAEKRKAAEMDNAIRRGELHRTEDIERGMSAMVMGARARLLAVPAKMSGRLSRMGGDQSGIFDALTGEMNEALEELSRMRIGGTEDDDGRDGQGALGHGPA